MSNEYKDWQAEEIKELEAKVERLEKDLSDSEERCKAREKVLEQEQAKVAELENQLASGVHTCSNQCQRPMCVLRRENRELEAQVERLEPEVRLLAESHTLLEAEVKRLKGFINDLLDPKTNWALGRIQAHLARIDEWQKMDPLDFNVVQEGKQDDF